MVQGNEVILMKKIISISIFLTLTVIFTISAVCAPLVPDTSLLVPQKIIENIQFFGLSEKVIQVFSADERTITIQASKLDEYLSCGWYLYPVITLYEPLGNTTIVYKSDADTHLKNGWYKSPDDFPKRTKAVALTYDDGPSKYTSQILDCLETHGAKATFFVVGSSVPKFSTTVLRAHNMGMEIGNHTMSHPNLKNISSSSVSSEITGTNNAVKNITGTRPSLVRPPYGSYNSSVMSAAGLPFILWSIDTLDWKTRNASKTVSSILSNVKDGDIILMHDLYKATKDATDIIVPELIKMGFDLVTVSELAERKGKTLTSGKAYSSIK